jgi:hypothetical protein
VQRVEFAGYWASGKFSTWSQRRPTGCVARTAATWRQHPSDGDLDSRVLVLIVLIVARRTARIRGVPIYIWEKGKIIAVKRQRGSATPSDREVFAMGGARNCVVVDLGRGLESIASD